jgi:hypothetical protein
MTEQGLTPMECWDSRPDRLACAVSAPAHACYTTSPAAQASGKTSSHSTACRGLTGSVPPTPCLIAHRIPSSNRQPSAALIPDGLHWGLGNPESNALSKPFVEPSRHRAQLRLRRERSSDPFRALPLSGSCSPSLRHEAHPESGLGHRTLFETLSGCVFCFLFSSPSHLGLSTWTRRC